MSTKDDLKKRNLDLFGQHELAKEKEKVMKAAAGKGCACPICGQFVKVYKRSVTSMMARQIIHAWRCHGQSWFHTRDVVMQGAGASDFSKLEWWGLIEAQAHQPGDDGKKASGWWRITDAGINFIKGNAAIQAHAIVYNNKVLEMQGGYITIRHSLKNKFDYDELMKPAGAVAA